MLSVDDIRNVEFTKNLGGYKAAEVDDFLDQCEETVSSLLKDKADITAKMNVLADKLVEYRKDEDSLRTALLDAHKMADQIVKEAREKASEIQADARYKAEKMQEEAKAGIGAQRAELQRAQDEVAAFKSRVMQLYREQMALLEALPGEVKVVPKAAPVPPAAPATPEPAPAPANDTAASAAAPAADATGAPATSNSRYANLKFGEDYDIAEDAAAEDGKGRFKRKK